MYRKSLHLTEEFVAHTLNQGPFCQPYFITFPDHTKVKFYLYALQAVCLLEGKRCNGFQHEIN